MSWKRAGPDGRVRGRRRDDDARGDPRGRRRDPLLPGLLERDLRRAARSRRRPSETPLAPLTPYGVAKAYGHFITRSYRRRYGLHASSGILYNHESPRRPLDFVTAQDRPRGRRHQLGLQGELWLGNLDARRDWGYAGDYVRAMWLMLQQDEPGDYVIATGETHSVRDLVAVAFDHVGLDSTEYVHIDSSLERGKAELHDLVGDPVEGAGAARLGADGRLRGARAPARRRRPRAARSRCAEPDRGASLRSRRASHPPPATRAGSRSAAYRRFRRVLARLGLQVVAQELLQPDPRPRRATRLDLGARSELAGIRFDLAGQLAFLERHRAYLAEFGPPPASSKPSYPPVDSASCTRSCGRQGPTDRRARLGPQRRYVAAAASTRTRARAPLDYRAYDPFPSVARPAWRG